MDVSMRAHISLGLLLLTACASTVLTATLKGSFIDPEIGAPLNSWRESLAVKTPSLATSAIHRPVRDIPKSTISPSCSSTLTTTVTLQPTTSTLSTTFTSTKFHIVKRAVVSTHTVFDSTSTVTAHPGTISATPVSKAPASTPAVYPSSTFPTLQATMLNAGNGSSINSTSSLTESVVQDSIPVRLTNIVRRVVSMTVGLLLTPFAIAAQHLA